MKPSELPEVQNCLNLKRILAARVDMQFSDLEELMTKPEAPERPGFNFTAAMLMCGLIAGLSSYFYKTKKKNYADKFKQFVKDFYPCDIEKISKNELAEALWAEARGPLAHNLGFFDSKKPSEKKRNVFALKYRLTEEQIRKCQHSDSRPLPEPTISSRPSSGIVISLPTLYWGIHVMLRRFFGNDEQRSHAEQICTSLLKNN